MQANQKKYFFRFVSAVSVGFCISSPPTLASTTNVISNFINNTNSLYQVFSQDLDFFSTGLATDNRSLPSFTPSVDSKGWTFDLIGSYLSHPIDIKYSATLSDSNLVSYTGIGSYNNVQYDISGSIQFDELGNSTGIETINGQQAITSTSIFSQEFPLAPASSGSGGQAIGINFIYDGNLRISVVGEAQPRDGGTRVGAGITFDTSSGRSNSQVNVTHNSSPNVNGDRLGIQATISSVNNLFDRNDNRLPPPTTNLGACRTSRREPPIFAKIATNIETETEKSHGPIHSI